MAETTADVRRDIEVTRERMSSTLIQLEQKMNLTQVVKDHPWPSLAIAVGAGLLLSGSRADTRAAAATLAATQGASSKIGPAPDDIVGQLMNSVGEAFSMRVDSWLNEIKGAIGAPTGGTYAYQRDYRGQEGQERQWDQNRQQFADVSYGAGPRGHAAGSTGPTQSPGAFGSTGDQDAGGFPRAD